MYTHTHTHMYVHTQIGSNKRFELVINFFWAAFSSSIDYALYRRLTVVFGLNYLILVLNYEILPPSIEFRFICLT